MREIKNINYSISNVCNRACVDCSLDIPNRSKSGNEPRYVTISHIYESAKYFKGFSINLTGGEPTMHPLFDVIAKRAREIFKPSILSVETNGYGFKKFPEIFRLFDAVHFTHYIKGEYFNWDNSEDLEFMRKNYPEVNILVHEMRKHTPRVLNGNIGVCANGISETVSYINGLIYPCCIGKGVSTAEGIPLSETWSTDILKVELPCKDCFLAI